MSRLVLLTVSFPFKNEDFLFYEIEYLAKKFNKVDIVLLKGSKYCGSGINNHKIEQLPKNVEIKCDLKKSSLLNLYSYFREASFLKELLYARSFSGFLKTLYRYYNGIKTYNLLLANYKDKEHVVFYSYWINSNAFALSLLKRDVNNYCVTRAHGSDIYSEKSRGKCNPYISYIINSIDDISTISNDGKNYLEKKYNVQKEILVSRLGVPLDVKISRRFEKKGNREYTIVSCSRMDENKQLKKIIDALSLLDIKYIHWHHFGDGPLYSDLLKYVKENLNENIKYTFHGYKENKFIHKFYENNYINLFVNTSLSEGIPVSIMEAMSYGIPVIAPNVGGIPEIVNNNNGVLMSMNPNPEEISYSISKLINLNDNQSNYISNYCVDFVHEHYNAEINFNSFSSFLHTRV